jgi:hypothetical protein
MQSERKLNKLLYSARLTACARRASAEVLSKPLTIHIKRKQKALYLAAGQNSMEFFFLIGAIPICYN